MAERHVTEGGRPDCPHDFKAMTGHYGHNGYENKAMCGVRCTHCGLIVAFSMFAWLEAVERAG